MVALGSYARRELCPSSDIDILLLHDGWRTTSLEHLVRTVCYPLWDAGLQVGHAVRTPRQAVQAAAEDIETATALTGRRLVAGDLGLADELAVRMARWLRRGAGGFVGAIAAADAERHRRAGRATGLLEPDLKASPGGLRDLHSLGWAASAVLGEANLDALVGARYLGAADRGLLADASDVLLQARVALHLTVGRGGTAPDRLRLDLQDEVARTTGFGDGDDLLEAVGLAMRAVAHVHGRTWPRLLADARGGRRRRRPPGQVLADGVTLVDGLVETDPQRRLAADPALGWRAVAAAGALGLHLGRPTAERLGRELAEAGRLPADAEVRDHLLTLLRAGTPGLAAAADADHVGLVTATVPGWQQVRGRPQRNPLHRFDLDTHAWQAAAELADVAAGALHPDHRALYEGLRRPEALLLAAWLHDVGKAWPGDHSLVGADVASDWTRDLGFDPAVADQVGRLTRLHLLLPVAATRRDLDDERELRAIADEVGDTETLDGLLLLSLADARATGPAAHSPWKDGLLTELHARVRRRMLGRPEAPPPAGPDWLPVRYRLAAGDEQVAVHLGLLAGLSEPGGSGRPTRLRAHVRPGPAPGTACVSVAALDRRGLVADCAGVLAADGLPVLDARAFTVELPTGQRAALDWFVVATPEAVDSRSLESALAAVGDGAVDVAAAVERRERRRDPSPPRLAAPVAVDVSVELAAAGGTRVEVRGPDRPGVLYRLARVFADLGLDVERARVATLGPEVRDVFFLAGAVGDAAALEQALRDAAATGLRPRSSA